MQWVFLYHKKWGRPHQLVSSPLKSLTKVTHPIHHMNLLVMLNSHKHYIKMLLFMRWIQLTHQILGAANANYLTTSKPLTQVTRQVIGLPCLRPLSRKPCHHTSLCNRKRHLIWSMCSYIYASSSSYSVEKSGPFLSSSILELNPSLPNLAPTI